jgi:hypothetical protein
MRIPARWHHVDDSCRCAQPGPPSPCRIGDDVVPGNAVAGPLALFEPSGLIFRKPARMTLPLRPGLDTSQLFIQGVENNATTFKVPRGSITVGGSTAWFDVLGFTTFQPVLSTARSTDTDCGAGQVCGSGQCIAIDCGQSNSGSDVATGTYPISNQVCPDR